MEKLKLTTRTDAYRPDIDGLRAFAVILVILYHAFPEVVRGGFVGVDVFFVISGFLIGGIILRDLDGGRFAFSRFYARRILRIFPALALVLATVLIAGYFLLFDDEYEMLGNHVFGGAAFVSNLIYYSEAGYWDLDAKYKPLLHLWSLGVEEQFYIVIPVVLAAVWKWKRKYLLPAALALLLLASFVCNLYYYRIDQDLDFYMPFTRFWEIFIGVTLAALSGNSRVREVLEGNRRYWSLALSFAGLVCLVVGMLASRNTHHFPGHRALWVTFGAAFVIAAGSRAWLNRTLFSNRIAVGIGLISYPLYLWHWPLLSFASILNGEAFDSPRWWRIRLFCVLISIVLAFLTYAFVECPLRFGAGGRKKKIAALLVLMVCIGGAGLHILRSGAPERSFLKKYEAEPVVLSLPNPGADSAVRFDPETKSLQYARFHDAGGCRTVAVIGDSHAESAFPGVAARGVVHGFNAVLLPYRLADRTDTARRNMETTLSIIKSKKEVTDVFVVLRGMLYVAGKDMDGRGRYRQGIQYKSRLQELIDALREIGRRVYIVTENPVFPYLPRLALGRPFRNFGEELPVITREDVYSHQKEYLDMISGIRGAEIINGLDLFIRGNECSMLSEDGRSFYNDDDHLSLLGSKYLAENALEPYLSKIQ